MHVIWKRPDGFHGAEPSDFVTVDLGDSRLWLHRNDTNWFPFRISGGWQESEATKRLNNMVNHLRSDDSQMLQYMVKMFEDSMSDDAERYYADLDRWLKDLKLHLKGDTWEIDIMSQVVDSVHGRLTALKAQFLKATS